MNLNPDLYDSLTVACKVFTQYFCSMQIDQVTGSMVGVKISNKVTISSYLLEITLRTVFPS